MQIFSLHWGNVSKYCICNSITNLYLCGQLVPSTLNFLHRWQMIKQITCLHISKLTLLGYVIGNCSAHKGAGVHLPVGETHVNTLTQATIGSLHTPTTAIYLQGISHIQRCDTHRATKVIMECRGKRLGDGTSPVRGCLGEEPEVRKGKNHSDQRRNKPGKAKAMVTRETGHL